MADFTSGHVQQPSPWAPVPGTHPTRGWRGQEGAGWGDGLSLPLPVDGPSVDVAVLRRLLLLLLARRGAHLGVLVGEAGVTRRAGGRLLPLGRDLDATTDSPTYPPNTHN